MPRGGLLGIAAVGAGAVVVVIVGVVLIARACSDTPPPVPGPGTGSFNPHRSAADEGTRATGTAELRQLGCERATVVDMAKLLGDAALVRPGEPRTMVTCDVPAGVDPPTCERAAAVYFGAVGGAVDENVAIRILRAGSSTPVCAHLYAPSGADLGVFPRAP
jgi:hypothetical protein